MKRNYFLLLFALVCIAARGTAQTQPCYSDEMRKKLIAEHPDVLKMEADYERQIQAAIKKINFNTAAKTTSVDETGNEDFWYDIPIVLHIVHDYGNEYLSDSNLYVYLKQWNIVYAKQNADTADVVTPFKPYIGNPHIRLHLATIDPSGNPTHGITRHRSYLTYTGGEYSKFDDWEPTSYMNIWFINQMSTANGSAAAYAHLPADVTYIPEYDGVISLYDYANNDNTINHELGHCFNLQHPWGNTNNPGVACGDDGVDDTPPTKGHVEPGCQYALPSSNANSTYDSACAINYFKIYTNVAGMDSLADYPDTTNAQNVMDYTYCSKMFTKQQCTRMHAALNSTIGGRNNLWDPTNLANTGALAAFPDLKPNPDFTVANITGTGYLVKNANFAFPGASLKFTNRTMGDTVTGMTWTFDHTPTIATSTSTTTFTNSFADPGWVNISLKATGNHTGDTTAVFPNTLFIADNTATNPDGYFQEFAAGGDRDKWPTFNYFNNEFKWKLADVGFYDNSSIMYTGFDSRYNPAAMQYPTTGTPKGDYDDMFSVPMNLSAYTDGCNLDFFYSAASRTSNSNDITDTLLIDFSVNKSMTWTSLAKLGKSTLINKGAMSTAYVPTSQADWAPKTIALPAAAITPYTTFRFRYKPGQGASGMSSGNNFYMDRITFSNFPAEASTVMMGKTDIAVVPNPTKGDAFVIVNDANNTIAQITVTDITGKVVFTASQQINGGTARIIIPHTAVTAQGMYLVQTKTGSQVNTQKLVVY